MTSVVRVGAILCPISRDNSLYVPLGFPDKGRGIKVLVVFNLIGCKPVALVKLVESRLVVREVLGLSLNHKASY